MKGNKNWSCGGSSGGEGAIVGFRGGIIGVGTDIGTCSKLVEEAKTDLLQADRSVCPRPSTSCMD